MPTNIFKDTADEIQAYLISINVYLNASIVWIVNGRCKTPRFYMDATGNVRRTRVFDIVHRYIADSIVPVSSSISDAKITTLVHTKECQILEKFMVTYMEEFGVTIPKLEPIMTVLAFVCTRGLEGLYAMEQEDLPRFDTVGEIEYYVETAYKIFEAFLEILCAVAMKRYVSDDFVSDVLVSCFPFFVYEKGTNILSVKASSVPEELKTMIRYVVCSATTCKENATKVTSAETEPYDYEQIANEIGSLRKPKKPTKRIKLAPKKSAPIVISSTSYNRPQKIPVTEIKFSKGAIVHESFTRKKKIPSIPKPIRKFRWDPYSTIRSRMLLL